MTYELTEAIKNNRSRGLGLSQKFNIEVNSILKSGESISLDEVRQLYIYLNKQQDKYEPKKKLYDGSLTKDTIGFLANGGSSALAFCRYILRQEGILKGEILSGTDELFNTEDSIPKLQLPVNKATNEELMQATFVVMVPGEVDLHGDITSEAEVAKACHNYNKFSMRCNLFHMVETDTFEMAESYISPVDFVLGEKFVKKGTWLCTVQVIDKNLWSLIKSGEICSVSIGAMAKVEEIE